MLLTLLVIIHRRAILCEDWPLLAVALLFFGLSVVVDLATSSDVQPSQTRMLLEDGAKLLRICGWLGFFFRVAAR